QPPLPTAWNLPFQPETGIQTSILMSESDEGVRVAATRQNATELVTACRAADVPLAGRENPSRGTTAASVIVVFCAFSYTRLSQVCGAVAVSVAAGRAMPRIAPNITRCFIARSRSWRRSAA